GTGHGHLVPGDVGRQLHRRPRLGVLRVVPVAVALHGGPRVRNRRRARHVRPDAANQAVDGKGQLKSPVMLEKYKQKRNFNATPEPAGDVKLAAERAKSAKPDKGLFFCVQKHLASHLHYDFRLENNGVLLSSGGPKGASLDPKTKRVAMMVEDHPFEYGTFEGVIPSGYGAGIVMLWDQGTWTPQSDDGGGALKKGYLKFTLDGYKLKGSWVLVRTSGRYPGGGDRSWLLIKHKDDWAGDVDIAEFAPKSGKSDVDFADILATANP